MLFIVNAEIPSIMLDSRDATKRLVGEEAHFDCDIYGYPSSNVSWYFVPHENSAKNITFSVSQKTVWNFE